MRKVSFFTILQSIHIQPIKKEINTCKLQQIETADIYKQHFLSFYYFVTPFQHNP